MRIAYSVPRVVPVPFQVSRLLPKCRVIAFTLDAFPEGEAYSVRVYQPMI